MLDYERSLWDQGCRYIAGVDEVGRGCLFGDVVAAAVILPPDFFHESIMDSKKLTDKKREAAFELISEHAIAIGIGTVDAKTIDQINIKQAARLAMRQAVEQLSTEPEHLLVDAEKVESQIPQTAIIKGDALSQSIAAASIIAKVTRDRLCAQWDSMYPEYDLSKHKGYATKAHREAIQQYGATPMHRKSFLHNILIEQQTLF